jgi:alpha-glucosidase (family GH31 glycosyl hydrolase)
MVRLLLLGAALAGCCAADDNLTLFTRRQNLVRLTLDNGVADFEWIRAGSFRFSRDWDPNAPASAPLSLERVDFTITDAADELLLESKHLRIRIPKKSVRLNVSTVQGKPLMLEQSPLRRTNATATLERSLPVGEFFFGLGARPDGPLAMRNHRVETGYPFLLSTEGYGQYFPRQGRYAFELGSPAPDVCRISGPVRRTFEYFFYYGPAIKDIFEEHLGNLGNLETRADADFGILDKTPADSEKLPGGELRKFVHSLIGSSLSGIRLPAVDIGSLTALPSTVLSLATALPVVVRSTTEPAGHLLPWRQRLIPYLQTYLQEARDRGFPVIRALPMQFSKDPKGWEITDEFMLGDEILVAPKLSEAPRRSLYLPMGIWTDLRTNTAYKGRQTIDIAVADGELPLFIKNGSILPLAPEQPEQPLTLHYFPKLGGEFFLWEADSYEVSQFHAAPSADFMRVEIESKRDRIYEWVIHNVTAPRSVSQGEIAFAEVRKPDSMKAGSWRFDAAARNLHIRMEGPAGEDRVVNIRF